MKFYSLQAVYTIAKNLSGFYKELYKNIDDENWKLEDLPPIEQDKFWEYNTLKNNRVLTEKNSDGIIFKSGGTTGNPKFSFFTRDEWETMSQMLAYHLVQAGLSDGDKVANLFYAGKMYASFIFAHTALEACPLKIQVFPLSGSAEFELMEDTFDEFDVNALMGVPTTMINFVQYLQAKNKKLNINKIFYAGETMYKDQRQIVQNYFKDVKILSAGYASVDGGFLGYCDSSCGFNEHRMYTKHNIIEIVDEHTGEIIDDKYKEGKILTTNLSRLLMPLLRYPTGDYGMWVEDKEVENRKFVLLGRSEEGARIGPMTIYYEDIHSILEKYIIEYKIGSFQIVTSHEEKLDKAIIRLSTAYIPENSDQISKNIIQDIYRQRSMFNDLVNENVIHPLHIEWVDPSQIEINPRTGKTKRIIDLRIRGEVNLK